MSSSVPDIPIKLQVGQGETTSVVYIHRSRLEKVSLWFKRTTTHVEVIELDHVSVETLQTFYKWVYEDCVDVEGLEEEMAKREEDSENQNEGNRHTNGNGVSNERSSAVIDLTQDSEELDTDSEQDGDEDKRAKSTTPSTSDGGGEELYWYQTASLDTRGQIFGRLLDLYTFGVTYEVPSFKLDVMLTWQRFSYRKSIYPCATVVRNVNDCLAITSGLVQYIIG